MSEPTARDLETARYLFHAIQGNLNEWGAEMIARALAAERARVLAFDANERERLWDVLTILIAECQSALDYRPHNYGSGLKAAMRLAQPGKRAFLAALAARAAGPPGGRDERAHL